MLVPVLLFIVGLLFLIKGGDWFVDGASALARRFHRRNGGVHRHHPAGGHGVHHVRRVRPW